MSIHGLLMPSLHDLERRTTGFEVRSNHAVQRGFLGGRELAKQPACQTPCTAAAAARVRGGGAGAPGAALVHIALCMHKRISVEISPEPHKRPKKNQR